MVLSLMMSLHCFPGYKFFGKFMGWTWQKTWGIFKTWKIEGYPWFLEGFAANLNYSWKALCVLTLWRDKFIFKQRPGINEINDYTRINTRSNSACWSAWHKVVKHQNHTRFCTRSWPESQRSGHKEIQLMICPTFCTRIYIIITTTNNERWRK